MCVGDEAPLQEWSERTTGGVRRREPCFQGWVKWVGATHDFAIGLCCVGREGRQHGGRKDSIPLPQLCSGVCVLVVFLLMVATLKQHVHNWRAYRPAKMSPEMEIICVTSSPSGWLSDRERWTWWFPNPYWSPSLCSSSLLFSFPSSLPRTREMHLSPEAHRWFLPENGVLEVTVLSLVPSVRVLGRKVTLASSLAEVGG